MADLINYIVLSRNDESGAIIESDGRFGQKVAINQLWMIASSPFDPTDGGEIQIFKKTENGFQWLYQYAGSTPVQPVITGISGENLGLGSVVINPSGNVIAYDSGDTNNSKIYITIYGNTSIPEEPYWGGINGIIFSQPTISPSYGLSISLSDNWVVYGNTTTQKVYVVSYNVGAAIHTGTPMELELSEGIVLEVGDDFGYSVAIGQLTIIVGIPGRKNNIGAVQTYSLNQSTNTWNPVSFIEYSGIDPLFPLGENRFGSSLSLNNSRCLVGAPQPTKDKGFVAYLVSNGGSTWIEEPNTILSSSGVYFGVATSYFGKNFLIGAPNNLANTDDNVYYGIDGIINDNRALFLNQGESEFGSSVALDFSFAAIGAPNAFNPSIPLSDKAGIVNIADLSNFLEPPVPPQISEPPTTSRPPAETNNIAWIVGGVFLGLTIIAIIALTIYLIKLEKRKPSPLEQNMQASFQETLVQPTSPPPAPNVIIQ